VWPLAELEIALTYEHFDVLVVGGGLSGIGAGYHLQAHCPHKTYAILEGRDCAGGTWDLFRYPGVRSDSDMFTLGYSFRPWKEAKAIADGPSILKYIRETAKDYGIDKMIRFNHQVNRAAWSSKDATWTVEADRGASGEIVRFTCNFLFMCSGYYSYAAGYTPDFPGADRFRGRIVHPQKWTDDIDHAADDDGDLPVRFIDRQQVADIAVRVDLLGTPARRAHPPRQSALSTLMSRRKAQALHALLD
jgi:monooxygenase